MNPWVARNRELEDGWSQQERNLAASLSLRETWQAECDAGITDWCLTPPASWAWPLQAGLSEIPTCTWALTTVPSLPSSSSGLS